METLRKYNEMALLTGLALILFVIEMQVPPLVSLPGVKMGLANVVTVYAVYRFRAEEAVLILLARILLAAFFAGQAAAFLYSLCGGLFCITSLEAADPGAAAVAEQRLRRGAPQWRTGGGRGCDDRYIGGACLFSRAGGGRLRGGAFYGSLRAAGARPSGSPPGLQGNGRQPNKLKKIDLID